MKKEEQALADYMSDLSEEAYCAGWVLGLEHALWTAVVEGPRDYGRLKIEDSHINRLRELSSLCGGWIYFDAETEETFIPLDDWRVKYRTELPQMKARMG